MVLVRNHVIWRIKRTDRLGGIGCTELQEPPPTAKENQHFVEKLWAYGGQKPLFGLLWNFARGVPLWRNHPCKFWWRSFTGFLARQGSKGRFPWTCFVALTTLSHYLASVWLLVIYITVDIPLLQKHRMTTNHAAGHCERPPLSTRWGPVPHIWTEPTCSACKHRHYTQCRHIEQAVSAALRALPELNWIEITDRQTCMKDMCWQSMIRLIQF